MIFPSGLRDPCAIGSGVLRVPRSSFATPAAFAFRFPRPTLRLAADSYGRYIWERRNHLCSVPEHFSLTAGLKGGLARSMSQP